MSTCTNIGIYIGEGDKDIAAWFNLLQRSGQSRARWVRALMAANALGKPLKIGIVDTRAPLIRAGPQKGDHVEPKGGFKYGWQIRGPEGEFVIGSVVNLSIRGDEARDLLDEAWSNGHMLAPFVKSLIRGSLKFGDKEIPPKADVMRQIWSEFLVSVNGKMTGKKEKMILPAKEKAPVEDWAAEFQSATQPNLKPKPEPKPALEPEPQPQPVDPERTISFRPDPEKNEGLPKKPSLGRNPLLSQI